ncbi:D-aminoacyl-tRNA deacylase [Vitis vinifera]|uniref:D-aminoacyl-tRNA deacylase n=1 Tax=Vitis vinifera TaxID=29760 RepID=A0A438IGD1_VITVI|nr:D-aminoacyl-tRNA deacylase [Vitis vinifera]
MNSVACPSCCSIIRTKHRSVSRRRAQVRAMRAIVQRVSSASVEVCSKSISLSFLSYITSAKLQFAGGGAHCIGDGPGLLVLVGVHESDTDSDADYICRKVLNMRLFPNETTGRAWDQSVVQKNYGVLLVSQFTLYGILKGNKPDFHVAMPPKKQSPFMLRSLIDSGHHTIQMQLKGLCLLSTDGVFGAMMKVNLVNDGPVTMQLDSSQPSKNAKDGMEEP